MASRILKNCGQRSSPIIEIGRMKHPCMLCDYREDVEVGTRGHVRSIRALALRARLVSIRAL